MSESVNYLSHSHYPAAGISAICSRAEQEYDEYEPFSDDVAQSGFFHCAEYHLPVFPASSGIRYGMISVEGTLPLTLESFTQLKNIFIGGSGDIGKIGRVYITCGFEDKNIQQTAEAYDSITLRTNMGRLYYSYALDGSYVSRDKRYHENFLTRLVDVVDLPVRIKGLSGDILIDRGDKEIVFTDDFLNFPRGVTCELVNDDLETLLKRMDTTLTHFATEKRYEYSWTASPDPTSRLFKPIPESLEIYQMIVNAGFPAERYEIQADFFLDALEEIDALQGLCGAHEDDEINCQACSFMIDEDTWANLGVQTTREGHRLQLETRDAVDIDEVNTRLGTDFRAE